MSQKNLNDIMENIISGLVYLAKHGTNDQIEKVQVELEVMWKDIDEVLSTAWFNKEISKLWREYLKNKEIIPKNT